jgi:hypothetical protein
LQLVTEGVGKSKHEVIYGQWVIGNNYRNKTTYYGAYPAGYLARIHALFPDHRGAQSVLHAFSGSLPVGSYIRCDMTQPAECQCRVEDLPQHKLFLDFGPWYLVLADPPYSAPDATKYGTPMINRGKVMRALAHVTAPGGHVVWLDTTWPMHRKDQWRTVGRIGLTRSTNHRTRMVTIFERVAA